MGSTPHPVFFQALQKIRLANHIKSMAELHHADAIQQLEVALLGSLAAQILALFAKGLMQLASTPQRHAIHASQAYTLTLMEPPPSTILISGITSSSLLAAAALSSDSEATVFVSQEIPPKHGHILPTSIQPPESFPLPSSPPSPGPSDKSTSYPALIVPEFAIPMEAQPVWIIQPGGGKEYQWQLCTFHHTNKDCMLTHTRTHFDITIGCHVHGKGFQNAGSLQKHGQKVQEVQIVASLRGAVNPVVLFASINQ